MCLLAFFICGCVVYWILRSSELEIGLSHIDEFQRCFVDWLVLRLTSQLRRVRLHPIAIAIRALKSVSTLCSSARMTNLDNSRCNANLLHGFESLSLPQPDLILDIISP